MSIQIQRYGMWQEVSKQEFLELVRDGAIEPDTEVVVNDQKVVASRLKGVVFPSQVAVPSTRPVPATPSPGVAAQAEIGQFGRVLASGNGKGNSVIFATWAVMLPIILLVLVVFCAILPSKMKGDAQRAADSRKMVVGDTAFIRLLVSRMSSEQAIAETIVARTIVFLAGIISAFFSILGTMSLVRAIAKTEITVYDNGIVGIGFGKYFELRSFQITYDKITVDTTGPAIIVYASGAQYKCYVANPAEIQRVIFNQQQKLST